METGLEATVYDISMQCDWRLTGYLGFSRKRRLAAGWLGPKQPTGTLLLAKSRLSSHGRQHPKMPLILFVKYFVTPSTGQSSRFTTRRRTTLKSSTRTTSRSSSHFVCGTTPPPPLISCHSVPCFAVQMLGEDPLEHYKPVFMELLEDTDENKQRGAAELLAGLIGGTGLWWH